MKAEVLGKVEEESTEDIEVRPFTLKEELLKKNLPLCDLNGVFFSSLSQAKQFH